MLDKMGGDNKCPDNMVAHKIERDNKIFSGKVRKANSFPNDPLSSIKTIRKGGAAVRGIIPKSEEKSPSEILLKSKEEFLMEIFINKKIENTGRAISVLIEIKSKLQGFRKILAGINCEDRPEYSSESKIIFNEILFYLDFSEKYLRIFKLDKESYALSTKMLEEIKGRVIIDLPQADKDNKIIAGGIEEVISEITSKTRKEKINNEFIARSKNLRDEIISRVKSSTNISVDIIEKVKFYTDEIFSEMGKAKKFNESIIALGDVCGKVRSTLSQINKEDNFIEEENKAIMEVVNSPNSFLWNDISKLTKCIEGLEGHIDNVRKQYQCAEKSMHDALYLYKKIIIS